MSQFYPIRHKTTPFYGTFFQKSKLSVCSKPVNHYWFILNYNSLNNKLIVLVTIRLRREEMRETTGAVATISPTVCRCYTSRLIHADGYSDSPLSTLWHQLPQRSPCIHFLWAYPAEETHFTRLMSPDAWFDLASSWWSKGRPLRPDLSEDG